MPLSLSRRDALRKLIVGTAGVSLATAARAEAPATQPAGVCVLMAWRLRGAMASDAFGASSTSRRQRELEQ